MFNKLSKIKVQILAEPSLLNDACRGEIKNVFFANLYFISRYGDGKRDSESLEVSLAAANFVGFGGAEF